MGGGEAAASKLELIRNNGILLTRLVRVGMICPQMKRIPENRRRQRLQVPLDEDIIERIDRMAEKLGHSQSQMASLLLTAAVRDNEWLVNTVSVPLRRMLDAFDKLPARNPANPQEADR